MCWLIQRIMSDEMTAEVSRLKQNLETSATSVHGPSWTRFGKQPIVV